MPAPPDRVDHGARADGPLDLLARWPRLVRHGRGLAQVSTLPALLAGANLLTPRQADRTGADAVLAWGRKPSADRAEAWAAAHKLPLLRLEDGFLRSLALGPDEPPLSLVLDDQGIYYDASRPSRLEQLVAAPLATVQAQRALALQAAWCEARVSKYNQAREVPGLAQDGDVLVVDQTFGDASIAFGAAGPAQFHRMLEAALDEHPGARILLKTHPDVVAGRKRGHFDQALSKGAAQRVCCVSADVHAPALLSRVAAVYTVTSQLGFEALLWGRPVRCFGLPFYAGWGLTRDEQPAPSRRGAASLAALVHAALVAYPVYLHPETGQRCEVEALLSWMGLQRRLRERYPAQVVGVGFSWWKRPIVRRFFAGSRVQFQRPADPLPPAATLVLWGHQPLPAAAGSAPPQGVVRLEDGFLRSVGLGADLRQPMSWVQDEQGLYYDATAPSGLERLLQTEAFAPGMLQRAALLRERIVAEGVTKYNLTSGSWHRPAGRARVVLVVGQVEDDASIRYGAPGICTNLGLLQAVRQACPDDWLVYKPHPDVVARLRQAGQGEQDARQHCDELVTEAPIQSLLQAVDQVHVLTSLTGFEALLRGTAVVVWGCPFYAGWGLTDDRQPNVRRRRPLTLDMLVAGALILYPTYVSRTTGRFTTPERVLDELLSARQRATAAETGVLPSLWQAGRRAALRWAVRWRKPGV